MERFCRDVNNKFQIFGQHGIICNPERWVYDLTTNAGNPLIYQIFNSHLANADTTLFLCGIHGDEASTVYLCIHLVKDIIFDNPGKYQHSKIVIAPIINPDSLLASRSARTNGNGVDLNRNFPTLDWDLLAHKSWKNQYHQDPRRYPGPKAGSEIETTFQIQLIEKYRPNRIIAIHSPYGFLDFDYGEGKKDSKLTAWTEVRLLAQQISKECGNFKVNDFPFFPGSLGNYAGRERKIPTFTLELPGNKLSDVKNYWQRFGAGLTIAIQGLQRPAATMKKIAASSLESEGPTKTAEN